MTGNNGPRIKIRPARSDDLVLIVEMLAADTIGGHSDSADPAAADGYRRAFERIAESPNEEIHVAEWDGIVVGTFTTALLTTLSSRGARHMLVQTVQVRSDFRGKGIGHEMMKCCIELAREAGAASLDLRTNKLRKDAHRFYERLGFGQTHYGYKLSLE